MRNKIQWLVAAIVVFGGGLNNVGCVAAVRGQEPRNVSFVEPIQIDDGAYNYITPPFALKRLPPSEILDRWRDDTGLAVEGAVGDHCGKSVTIGDPSTVYFRHAQVVFFATHPEGKGPAGRGDYRVELDEGIYDGTSGGRLVTRYESYVTSRNEEYYAWLAVISDRPFGCARHSAKQTTKKSPARKKREKTVKPATAAESPQGGASTKGVVDRPGTADRGLPVASHSSRTPPGSAEARERERASKTSPGSAGTPSVSADDWRRYVIEVSALFVADRGSCGKIAKKLNAWLTLNEEELAASMRAINSNADPQQSAGIQKAMAEQPEAAMELYSGWATCEKDPAFAKLLERLATLLK